jgi:HD-GYP domain-containing protein (c-di-GMP phosphodiesterase class II)
LAGAVLIGSSVENLAAQTRAATLSQVTFYTADGSVIRSTLLTPVSLEGSIAQSVIDRQEEGSFTRTFVDNGIQYTELLSTWEARNQEDIGLMGVAIPMHFLERASQISRTNTIWLINISLLLVVLIGLVVARRISLPIRKLRDAAAQVAAGNLRVQVPLPRRDEVGILTESFNQMVQSLDRSKRDLVAAYDKTIEGWAKATDLRDHETEGHSRRVADLSVALAKTMGFSNEQLVHVRRGALLHDIGKIAIPDDILLKKGKLNPVEIERMRQHPAYAKSFIDQIEFLKPALAIPFHHHERWDGTGYPHGLKGEKIPLEARIFAVVDVWDALTSDRPYRKAEGFAETIKHIEAGSGTHFDPAVVIAFKKMLGRSATKNGS